MWSHKMIGYKGFNRDWTCAGKFQYQVGQTYEMNEIDIQLCSKGFHFCRHPLDVLSYYNDTPNSVYAQVRAEGKIIEGKDKCVTNKITIIKQLNKAELLCLMSGLIERLDGDKEWYRNGQRHRLDEPAVERSNGDKEWYQNGQYHRLDGPAIERSNGDKIWYQNDQRHRLDGPAVELSNGDKEWYQNDQLHRLDGPAVERSNGDKIWYQNGQRHRLDGPAVELSNGDKEWYQNGQLHHH